MIAALYVQANGCYYGLDGVDPWDVHRDALIDLARASQREAICAA